MIKKYEHYTVKLELLEHNNIRLEEQLEKCKHDHMVEQRMILVLQAFLFIGIFYIFVGATL